MSVESASSTAHSAEAMPRGSVPMATGPVVNLQHNCAVLAGVAMHLSLPYLLASAKEQLGAANFNHVNRQGTGSTIAILAALHAGMLETGFVSQFHGQTLTGVIMPLQYASAGVFSLQYTFPARQSRILTPRAFFSKWRKIWIRDVFWAQHPRCWGQNTSRIQNREVYATLCLQALPEMQCTLCAVPFRSTIMIHGGLHSETGAYTKCCSSSIQPHACLKTTDLATVFECSNYTNFAALSRAIKDSIAHPLLRSAQVAAGLPATVCLAALMPEILNQVLQYLDTSSLVAIAAVSRQFNHMAQSPTLWRSLFSETWGAELAARLAKGQGAGTWKQRYIKEHTDAKRRCGRRALRLRRVACVLCCDVLPFLVLLCSAPGRLGRR